jgi:hypothetical protein
MIECPNATSGFELGVNVTPVAPRNTLWRDLYLLAIFEAEPSKILERIQEAERALTKREHELCSDPQGSAEREAVINALHCLDALRHCSKGPRRQLAA